MKSTGKDYFAQLRSDYIPPEKKHHDNNRRPFNPGDPHEFDYKSATMRRPDTDEENTIASTGDDNGVTFNIVSGNAVLEQHGLPPGSTIF